MKNCVRGLLVVLLLNSLVPVAYAAKPCPFEQSAYNRADAALSQSQRRLDRLIVVSDRRTDQFNFKKADLQTRLDTAKANYNAAKAESGGLAAECGWNILGGIFTGGSSPNCIGRSGRIIARKLGAFHARVKSAEGRLNAYTAAGERQKQRDFARIEAQTKVVEARQIEFKVKENDLKQCLAAASATPTPAPTATPTPPPAA